MGIKLINKEWKSEVNTYRQEYVIDTESDMTSLPTCCTSSTAVVISTGKVYMVNTTGEWTEFGGGAQ